MRSEARVSVARLVADPKKNVAMKKNHSREETLVMFRSRGESRVLKPSSDTLAEVMSLIEGLTHSAQNITNTLSSYLIFFFVVFVEVFPSNQASAACPIHSPQYEQPWSEQSY